MSRLLTVPDRERARGLDEDRLTAASRKGRAIVAERYLSADIHLAIKWTKPHRVYLNLA